MWDNPGVDNAPGFLYVARNAPGGNSASDV